MTETTESAPSGKISEDAAAAEFDRFVELMDLDPVDDVSLSSEDKADRDGARTRVIRAISNGSLFINNAGEPVFTPQRTDGAETLTFHEPTGAALLEMDRVKKNADINKTYRLLQSITGVASHNHFSKLKMGDLKVCLAVLTLFMG